MTNYNQHIRFLIIMLIGLIISPIGLLAQEDGYSLSGKVLESGSGIPLPQAIISVASNSKSTNCNEEGVFTIELPSKVEKLMISFPGYLPTEVVTFGEEEVVIYLVPEEYKSNDVNYTTPISTEKLANATNAISVISKKEFENTAASSFDQSLNGKVPGLHIIEHSGMPGHSSWINLRGISSIFGRNEPILFIDGMIHEINFPKQELMEGHILNPMDIVDIEDIVDISVIKGGEANMGSAGSNGLLFINTEQNQSTGASILFRMYGGMVFKPKSQSVLNENEFKSYFTDVLDGEGYNNDEINSMYPWLNGDNTSSEYYRYTNKTDWQEEMFQTAALQKYYIFLKGGDDIATYNISTGFTRHDAPYDDWSYSRYNLRLNGKINLTKKLYIIPNTKVSLSDSYMTNMGPTSERNPITSSLQKSPLMTMHERSGIDGSMLHPYDDVGAFNISNPAVLIDKAMGSNRNFQLISSAKVGWDITSKLSITHLIGTSVNNDRSNIFLPEIGLVQLDSARNSPQDMVTEYRSLQNHTTLSYINSYSNKHNLRLHGGMRQMTNSYKNNQGYDLNTPSDHFRSLGQGTEYSYLRENGGQISELKWVAFYGDFGYSFRDKYYVRASMSYDGSSVFNSKNRYNFYPSVYAAWRLSSENFLNNSAWINDLKLRASYSQTGNMFSGAYQTSKMTYTGRRFNNNGVVIRDYNPNENLEAERKSTINVGLDFSFTKKAYNLHIDYHMSSINNLIINQSLPYNFGFTDYLDNGGSLNINGLEVAADGRFNLGNLTIMVDASITYQQSLINELNFINPDTEALITPVEGGEYIASKGNAINSFYGYETDGIYYDDNTGMVGPNGKLMGAGDVRYVDHDKNGIIDENDKRIIGDPNPDLFGAFSLAAKYKRFELLTLFNYSVGNDVYNYLRYKTTAMDNYANQSTDVLNRWEPGNTNATLPKATMGDPNGNNVFSDRWIEDGSFLRVRQVTLSYTTPNILSFNKETRFYVTGSNLFTFTGYTGYDPETMQQSSPYNMGIDYGMMPITPSIIFGIQLSL